MFYLTKEQCVDYCIGRGWQVDASAIYPIPIRAGFNSISFMVTPQRERLTDFCRALEAIFPGNVNDDCLFWLTDSQNSGSHSNFHLYYRLRQSYSDFRQIHQAPGHVFIRDEAVDMISFFELGLLFGWDFQLLSPLNNWMAIHNDELFTVSSSEPIYLDQAKSAFETFGPVWTK